jgi:hypothetical protein
MDLSPYLESLRRDLAAAAAPGGEQVGRTAELLASSLDASARLCFIEMLADAAAEITTKLDGPTVEVRLRGREADLVVSQQNAPAEVPPPVIEAGDAGRDMARLTLRLPEPLKEAVERAAATQGISVNQWLIRAASLALAAGAPQPHSARLGKNFTGYAQA